MGTLTPQHHITFPRFTPTDEMAKTLECVSQDNLARLHRAFSDYENTYDWKNLALLEHEQPAAKSIDTAKRAIPLATKARHLEQFTDTFYQKLFQTTIDPDINAELEMIIEALKSDQFLLHSSNILAWLHSVVLPVIQNWLNYAKNDLRHKQKRLSQEDFQAFKTYLNQLETELTQAHEAILSTLFHRIRRTLTLGQTIEDDDTFAHMRQALCELNQKHLHRPESFLHSQDSAKNPRNGLNAKTFHYFIEQFPALKRLQLLKDLVPSGIFDVVQQSKPNWLWTSRRWRYFNQPSTLYQLSQMHILKRQLNADWQTLNAKSNLEWDDPIQSRCFHQIEQLETHLDQLIHEAKQQRPGRIMGLFRPRTRRLFTQWIQSLRAQKHVLASQKQAVADKILQITTQNTPLTLEAIQTKQLDVVKTVRQVLKTHDWQLEGETQYLDKTDTLSQLLQAICRGALKLPRKNQLTNTLVTYPPVPSYMERLNRGVSFCCKNESELTALDTLIQLIQGHNEIFNQPPERVQDIIQPLSKKINVRKTYFFKMCLKQFAPPFIWGIQSPAFQFLKAANKTLARQWQQQAGKLAQKALERFQNLFDNFTLSHFLSDRDAYFNDIDRIRAASTQKYNYYSALVKQARRALTQQGMGTSGDFADLITYIGDVNLITDYGEQLFTNLIEAKQYSQACQHHFFTRHGKAPPLLNTIRKRLLDKLHTMNTPDDSLLSVCDHYLKDDMTYYETLDQIRFQQLQTMYQERRSMHEVKQWAQALTHLNHGPNFPSLYQTREQLRALMTAYDPAWDQAQLQLIEAYGTPIDRQNFYTQWLVQRLEGKHDRQEINPCYRFSILQAYGIDNFQNQILPLFNTLLTQGVNWHQFSIIKAHLPETLEAEWPIDGLRQKMLDTEKRFEAKDAADKDLQTIKALLFDRSYTEIQNKVVAISQYAPKLQANYFFQSLGEILLEQMTQSLISLQIYDINQIHRVSQAMPQNDMMSRKIQQLYQNRLSIDQCYQKLLNDFMLDFERLEKYHNNLYEHAFCFNLDTVDRLRHLPQSVLQKGIIAQLQCFEQCLPNTNPLKKACGLFAKSLTPQTELDHHERTYIKLHDIYKQILDTLYCIKHDFKLPLSPETLNDNIEQILNSPYCADYKSFWQQRFQPIVDKPRCVYLKSMITHLGSQEQCDKTHQWCNRLTLPDENNYEPNPALNKTYEKEMAARRKFFKETEQRIATAEQHVTQFFRTTTKLCENKLTHLTKIDNYST